MTDHPLDSPLWYAMSGSFAQYTRLVGDVRFLDPGIAPVAALKEVTPAGVSSLARALSPGSEIVAITPDPIPSTPELEVLHIQPLLQMVAERLRPFEPDVPVAVLSASDFPRMRDLVDLTRPGPLGPRAMELGEFRGIFDGDKLVSMAADRMRFDGYIEVATVCTHPDYRGRDYGKAVVSAIARRIVEAGKIPFLSVLPDNAPAIRVYERLGFAQRRTTYMTTVKRPAP